MAFTSADYRAQAAKCERASQTPGVSVRQADMLMAMARSWKTLANQADRLAEIMHDESEGAY
jgi:hypothetical protein